ncbi:MAG: hypothetical protein J5I94_24565, partial [Phaeodactylibacter sp.]|nr:hypothetical protein [Phaeodactylibacter sp.]
TLFTSLAYGLAFSRLTKASLEEQGKQERIGYAHPKMGALQPSSQSLAYGLPLYIQEAYESTLSMPPGRTKPLRACGEALRRG